MVEYLGGACLALARRGVGGRGWRAGGPMAVARRGGGAVGTRSLERTWHDAPNVVCWVWTVDCVCFPMMVLHAGPSLSSGSGSSGSRGFSA